MTRMLDLTKTYQDATGDSFTDSIRGLLKDAEGRLANHNDIDESALQKDRGL